MLDLTLRDYGLANLFYSVIIAMLKWEQCWRKERKLEAILNFNDFNDYYIVIIVRFEKNHNSSDLRKHENEVFIVFTTSGKSVTSTLENSCGVRWIKSYQRLLRAQALHIECDWVKPGSIPWICSFCIQRWTCKQRILMSTTARAFIP